MLKGKKREQLNREVIMRSTTGKLRKVTLFLLFYVFSIMGIAAFTIALPIFPFLVVFLHDLILKQGWNAGAVVAALWIVGTGIAIYVILPVKVAIELCKATA